MCKKTNSLWYLTFFLAFFITLVVTIFVKAGEGALTPESFIIGMIQGFCLNMTLETIIDLPAMGNKFVRALGVKKMEGPAAYFLRLLAIVFVIVFAHELPADVLRDRLRHGRGLLRLLDHQGARHLCSGLHHRRHRLHPSMKATAVICSGMTESDDTGGCL